jgi:hypothetical protein
MASDKFDVNGGLSVNGTTIIDASRNISAVGATFTGTVSIGGVGVTSVVSSFNGVAGAVTYSPRLATASLTGVASFGSEFVVSAAGAVSLTSNYVKSFNGATGAVTYSPSLASSSVTGVASFGNEFVVSAAGAVSLTSNYVKSFNGATGAVLYAPPLATSSVTGVASFSSSDFVVTTGAVSLTSGLVRTINSLTGAITLTAGTNVTLGVVGNTITINSSGSGGGGGTGPNNFVFGQTAPSGPTSGDFWYDSANGALLVYAYDGNSSQWIDVVASGIYSPPLATSSVTGVAAFSSNSFNISSGVVSLKGGMTSTTVDFSSAINRIGFTVTGLTSANQQWQFANNAGLTALLQNASGTVSVQGTIYSSYSYWNGSIGDGVIGPISSQLYNRRSAYVVMGPPFTQGATSYTAEDLLGLSLSVFRDNNLYLRKISSGVSGDGAFAVGGLTFNAAGSTFSASSLGLVHQEGTYAIKTVTGQTWVASNQFIECRVSGLTSADHDAEDAALEGVVFEINNVVAGVGFDIVGHSPDGTYGKYTVRCFGQSL